jgi:hypothetical protein
VVIAIAGKYHEQQDCVFGEGKDDLVDERTKLPIEQFCVGSAEKKVIGTSGTEGLIWAYLNGFFAVSSLIPRFLVIITQIGGTPMIYVPTVPVTALL